ncbi:MAG TPA: cytochrome c5 family protein [Moraxella sp.]|jgi:cytochrome c5|uniref:Cytochrome c5 family protein n=1 Tax=Faucicola osloensis TaxID=34062 RepID=A0A2I1RK48_FAUOS|nr:MULTISPECIES: c-type cytochrome [Pseudomonadota]PKZ69510.1 cytochrome c5 family protein [Moraxella osloensis]VXB45426.1 Cytochrome c5 family protein [Enhydrobacter sp. AX1]HCC66741.1 cytochrome c5 family protein [Moraxella sp.]
MLPISTRNATLASLMIALGLTMSACSKHESAESKPTEEIAAEQGEIARANHPMPVASQPASFVPPTAASAAATTTTATATPVSADAGEKLFSSVCATCHTAGLMGAPKLGDKADWAPRIAQGKDTLYKHAIVGYQGKSGVMPARGGSQASDEEVKAAVDYMVSKAS